jgi:dienelactone hydrolase
VRRYTSPIYSSILRLCGLSASTCISLALAAGCASLEPVVQHPPPEVLVNRTGASLGFVPQAIDGARRVQLTVTKVAEPSTSTVFAWLFEPRDGPTRKAAVVALHGCGGLYSAKGELTTRHRSGAEQLVAQGFVVLMPDSFGSRGLREICTSPYAQRGIDIAQRRLDAFAALDYLASKPDVDADRIALLGWSNGATTALASIDRSIGRPDRPLQRANFARAIAFYPGCGTALQDRLKPSVPVLLLLGSDDNWTPAKPCERWAEFLREPERKLIEIEIYAGAHHGFDGPGSHPVHRTDVAAAHSGKKVTVGGHPEARRRSWARVREWLAPLHQP